MKLVIKLTEGDLHRVVNEAVRNVLDNYESMDMDTFESPTNDDYTKTDEFKREFDSLLKQFLTDSEYLVVSSYRNGDSFNAIASKLGVGYERVRQLYWSSIRKIKGNEKFMEKMNNLLNGDYDRNLIGRVNNIKYRDDENNSIEEDYVNFAMDAYREVAKIFRLTCISNPMQFKYLLNKVGFFREDFINFFTTHFNAIYTTKGYEKKPTYQEYTQLLSNIYDGSFFYRKWGLSIYKDNKKYSESLEKAKQRESKKEKKEKRNHSQSPARISNKYKASNDSLVMDIFHTLSARYGNRMNDEVFKAFYYKSRVSNSNELLAFFVQNARVLFVRKISHTQLQDIKNYIRSRLPIRNDM